MNHRGPFPFQEIKTMSKPLFPLGRTVATPGAVALLEELGIAPSTLIDRHVTGDDGDLGAADKQANRDALKHDARIFSVYKVGNGQRIYVITEADRSSTCLLLPSDY